MKLLFHLFMTVLLTVLTQIGGVIYLLSLAVTHRAESHRRMKSVAAFLIIYLLLTYLLVPAVAPLFGRERLYVGQHVKPKSALYQLFNRGYVTPDLNRLLSNVDHRLDQSQRDYALVTLDANFPFFDGFPLLPHLSHDDGRKLDVGFVYRDSAAKITSASPTRSGYGHFARPRGRESDQPAACTEAGHRQYDMTKYLTFGTTDTTLTLDEESTKELIELVLKESQVEKAFLEPHLIERMGLSDARLRYHGCHAVRHDDHLHLQVR